MKCTKLIPRTAAGRSNRRARAFSDEIARLHKEGYGYVAIQEALADVGVVVSKSTVQREVARIAQNVPSLDSLQPIAHQTSELHTSNAALPPPHGDATRSGKDIAEAFIKGQITNPLIRTRS